MPRQLSDIPFGKILYSETSYQKADNDKSQREAIPAVITYITFLCEEADWKCWKVPVLLKQRPVCRRNHICFMLKKEIGLVLSETSEVISEGYLHEEKAKKAIRLPLTTSAT